MACLLTSRNIQIMQTLPLTGPGGDQLLTPSLQLFLLLKQYIYILVLSALCRICVCCVIREYVIIQRKVKVPVKDAQAGRVDSSPPPLPAPLAELWGGGEVGEPCSAWGFWAGKGGSLASKFGGSYSRVDLACFHGKTFWLVYLAGQFGTFIWRVFISNERHAVEQEKKKKSKGMYYSESVDCIMSLYCQ